MKLKKFLSSLLIAVLIGATTVVAGDVANLNKQLLVDGNMEDSDGAPVSAWLAGNNATLSKETTNPHGGDQVLKVLYSDTNTPYAYQAIVTAGIQYRITGWGRGDITASPQIRLGSSTSWTGTSSTAWQYIDVIDTPIGTGWALLAASNALGAGQYAEFDDIVVTQIQSGDWKNTNKQLLVDGNMERVNTTAYTLVACTPTKDITKPHGGNRTLRLTKTGAGTGTAYQTITTIGKTYRITGWGRGDGGGNTNPRITDGVNILWNGTNSVLWQHFDETFITPSANPFMQVAAGGIGEWTEFDDVVITEVQHGDAKNPYKQILVDGNMERVGVGAEWSPINSATLTKETGNPHGGDQVIRIAWNGTFSPGGRQTILTSGKRYRATGWAHGDGAKAPKLVISPFTTIWTGTNSTAWQYFDETFVAGGTFFHLITDTSAAGYSEWDDIVVTEY